MKRLGIVGGIGPESTVEYYRSILAICREQSGDGPAPSILVNSIDVRKMLALISAGDMAAAVEYLGEAVDLLANAGADFGLLAANTPHIVFGELSTRCRLPLLSIVEAVREHTKSLGLRNVGLLGTRFVMQAHFYPDVFAKSQISVVMPSEAEQEYVHCKYIQELLNGVFLPTTRSGLVSIMGQMKERDGIEGVILGGTELPLILKDKEVHGLPLLDTTQIHAHAAVKMLLDRNRMLDAQRNP